MINTNKNGYKLNSYDLSYAIKQIKKGEKVDYAIMQNNEVIILIECKQAKDNLNDANMSQLYRYFAVTKSRIAILTNGINYLFFSNGLHYFSSACSLCEPP